jgi:hypothetical protein
MKTQWVCRETEDCKGHVSEKETCDKCGKKCQEELQTGEVILRMQIPEYTLRDINAIEAENTKLINEMIFNTDRFFTTLSGLMKNIERRNQLQTKMKHTVEHCCKKLRLHKDRYVRWGYDAYKKTLIGFKKPDIGKPEYKNIEQQQVGKVLIVKRADGICYKWNDETEFKMSQFKTMPEAIEHFKNHAENK